MIEKRPSHGELMDLSRFCGKNRVCKYSLKNNELSEGSNF